MIKAIIVDDEQLARQRIQKLLEPYNDIKVIGEARNGQLAIDLIEIKSPDLMFLDVQMPDYNGFEVLKRIGSKRIPYVVFTTAYDRYAIEAFKVQALDYLLKPIDEDRFEEAINRVIDHFSLLKQSVFGNKLANLLKEYDQVNSEHLTHIIIRDKGLEFKIDFDDVFYFEASGNYVSLVTKDKSHLYRTTMNSFYNDLDSMEFLRIHRSYILNKRYIKSCKYLSNGEFQFTMKNNRKLISGRSYKDAIQSYQA